MVAWQHYAVAVLVKRQRLFLKAEKFCHAAGNQAVYLLPVLLLKKAEQLQMHVKALCPQPAHGAKQLLYPFFAHQTADEQESRRIVSGVRRVDIAVQVYTRTMQNDFFFGRQDVSAAKFYRIGLIFKEYVLYTQKRKLVKKCGSAAEPRALKSAAESLYGGVKRNAVARAEKTHVYIRLNGVCKHKIRLFQTKNTFVRL